MNHRSGHHQWSMAPLALVLIIVTVHYATSLQTSAKVSANVGEDAILPCSLDFPDGIAVPYVVQWQKRDSAIPIYIWYDGYPPHTADEFTGRATLAGRASLNLTNVRDSDHGWYECKIFFLNRSPGTPENGSWVLLDVQTPPHFKIKPPDVVYVKVGESVNLPCEANGTPSPAVSWFKDRLPIEPAPNIQILRNELRISSLRQIDMGDYQCSAENREGVVSATTRLIVAGPAVITGPPRNLTRLEGDTTELVCITKALPSNVTYRWLHDGSEVQFDSRISLKRDGTLVISPTASEDSGVYTCEASNGIGLPDAASASLTVEFPARVVYSPTIQFLPLGQEGVVRCHVEASPPFQFITWTKDRRPFDPNAFPDVEPLTNGSLLFKRVNQDHQGSYRCTPYNVHGTAGSSSNMDVLVREAPLLSTAKPTGPAWSSHGDFARSTSTTANPSTNSPNNNLPPNSSRPGSPRNVTVQRVAHGYAISWTPPAADTQGEPVAYYYVEYKENPTDPWKHWGPIAKETSYLARGLKPGQTYVIRVVAYTSMAVGSATQIYEFDIPGIGTKNSRDKAIAAGVVGGILFFVAAIVLSVCAVKICNKRKRRQAEKAYMMVTCPIMDTMAAKQYSQDRIPSVETAVRRLLGGPARPGSLRSEGSGQSCLPSSLPKAGGQFSSRPSMEMLRAASSLASFHSPDLRDRPLSAFEHNTSFRPRRIQPTESQRRRFDERIAQIRRERALAVAARTAAALAANAAAASGNSSNININNNNNNSAIASTHNSSTTINNSYLQLSGTVPQSPQNTLGPQFYDGQPNSNNPYDSSYTSSSTSDSCQV